MNFPWREWLIQELERRGVNVDSYSSTDELWTIFRRVTKPEREKAMRDCAGQ